ncbi:MAG: Omp28-related outer membrane protein [Bacteroidia bacterium]|nr:Omp28-related outer membrane protein [Bacteroidia bacterium]
MHRRLLRTLFACVILSALISPVRGQTIDAVEDHPVFADIMKTGSQVPASLAGTAGQWTTGPALLSAKCYEGAAWHDGHLYVFGGLGADLRYDLKCYKLDAASGLWSAIAALPLQRALPAVQTVNGKIYLIGGYSSTSPFTVQPSVLEYDPVANTYTTKSNMPTPVYGGGSFVHNGRIWVLGGGTTAFTTSSTVIQIYDPATDRWTTSSSLTPYTAWAQGVAVVGNTVLFVGGVRYTNGQGLYGAWAYKGAISGDDITWTQIANYPDGSVMRFSAGSDGSKMYFSGGYNAASQNNGPPSGKTYAYDPAQDTWIMMDQKPTPVYFASQLIFDGTDKLYMIGGNHQPSGVTAAVEILNVNAAGGPLAHFATTSFDVWLKNGGSVEQNLPIRNNGSAPLTWEATVVEPAGSWMSLATASGSVPPGEVANIAAVLNSSSGNGVHQGKITVTTNDPIRPSTDLSLTLHVQDEDVDAEQNVLMEEGTGTWCGFCPYGADSLKAMIERFPGRVHGIAYHGGSATEPMQTVSTGFWTGIIKLTGWPQGSVNRIVFKGQSAPAISRSLWNSSITEVLQTRRSPISLNVLAKTYDPVSKRTSITVEVLFHRDLAIPVRLNIAQVQDQMNYTQVFYPPEGGSTRLFPYFHNHVMRQVIPSDAGEVISGGATVRSQTRVTKTFNFTSVDSTVETSRFIIYAHHSDGVTFGEILQSTEAELGDFILDSKRLPGEASLTLHQNYPNPFNPSTMVSFDLPQRENVILTVNDLLGREVARLADGEFDRGRHSMSFHADGLTAGTYILTLRSGNTVLTRSMTFMK